MKESDYKLDTLEKELGRDVSYLKKANQELEEAAKITESDNSGKLKCFIFIFVVVLIAGALAYYFLFVASGKSEPEKKSEDPKDTLASFSHNLVEGVSPTKIYRALRLLTKNK